jgi:molybdenum cofactor synthesis domain-containing protein
MAKTAGILIIGSEVLSGKVTDQNSPFLVRELRDLGVEVQRISTIPDDVQVIARDVREYARQFDLLFTTGGIGPTHDDVTIEAIAAAFDRRVVRHPVREKALRRYYGAEINPAELKMAEIPEGGRLTGEEDLSFPVLVFRNIYIFPGIPEAVRQKFARIREQFREPPYVLRRVFLRGDEGKIAEDLHAVLDRYPALQLGSYPILHNPDHNVMLTLESKDASYVEHALQCLLRRLPNQIVVRVE